MTSHNAKTYQKHPLKIYIQDIYRAKPTEYKYIYNLFGCTFKNVMIHGVVTEIYNKTKTSVNLEVSDPTGSVKIYCDILKNNKHLANTVLKELYSDFANSMQAGDANTDIMTELLTRISEKHRNVIDFEQGDYIRIVGDISNDEFESKRSITAFECNTSSLAADIMWLEELRYLYEQFYLWNKTC